jgi:putative copper export protein
MYSLVVLLHVLGACVWAGGHLVLALVILPQALRTQDPEGIRRFESGYEKIGIPALLLQIGTGFWLLAQMLPEVSQWLAWSDSASKLAGIKLSLLLLTALLALDARLRLIPRLTTTNLNALAWHIVPVTAVAVLFVVVGVGFRFGWLM